MPQTSSSIVGKRNFSYSHFHMQRAAPSIGNIEAPFSSRRPEITVQSGGVQQKV